MINSRCSLKSLSSRSKRSRLFLSFPPRRSSFCLRRSIEWNFNGSGTLNVNAGYRNGIKSTDDLKVVSGTFNITSNEDGIIGKDFLGIKDGKFTIKSGSDGMKSTYDTDTSKGNIVITGSEFDITASNDGVHCNEDILISGGNLTISSGDDGVHADAALQVDGGTIDIKKCYEGLEGVHITLNDGDISIVASDDGINEADGSLSSRG